MFHILFNFQIFPTVLPSGKVVDQSTIDKHSEEEAKWGRLPSDPFTGLEFTPHRKAILNLALKARIEKFLMENSEHFKTVPRSLGSSRVRRSKNRHASQFASLCHQHTPGGVYSSLSKSYKTTATATLSSTDNNSDLIDTAASYALPTKRARLMDSTAIAPYSTSSSVSTGKSRLHKKYTTSVTSSTTLTSCSTPLMLASTATQTSATATASFAKCSTLTTDNANAAANNTTNPHAAAATATSTLSSNSSATSTTASGIDQAIQQALQKITRFSQLPLQPAPPPVCCIKCQTTEFSYEIQTCRHLVCRECLVTLTRDEKCICSIAFRSCDVERYHKL